MNETENSPQKRKELLKHLITQLHKNEAPEIIRKRLIDILHKVPYNEVVEVEQELISEGFPEEEILRLCDIHAAVLDGNIDTSEAKEAPEGHPVDTFKQENRELEKVTANIRKLFAKAGEISDAELQDYFVKLKTLFNMLSDVDKHYKRKEFLLFPYLEKAGITGPPVVMWGKHDEERLRLKEAHKVFSGETKVSAQELPSAIEQILEPAVEGIEGMIMKEEQILLPMCLDVLAEDEWFQIYTETPEFGYCLYDPAVEWKPANIEASEATYLPGDAVRLYTGRFDIKELEALFSALPVDISFVDKDDKVRFFSHSPNRVFERNRSVLGRDVRMCHPPKSVDIVEQIIADFKSGKENKAAFWLSSFMERFIYIEYVALRGPDNEYLGVLEITQDITNLRQLSGDQRLLSYSQK